ncbi:hypothetical protein C2S53_006075 [Perilla frutescens var. hirtella]|uniref:F-box domain-containing protein n=1 Tax=Perilla frutescens var. hirtella TaxID=608512 RepID=A0AAD4JFF1_PERFH|nr:hypothetical protein C2S53_006075 [Perilla frutescens var. hirtella]
MEEDRMSQLPDAILQQIISFINIKQAVQTTILSKRWKNLWFSLSDLDFNFNCLAIHSRVNLKNMQASRDFFHLFAQFVDHFLSHRDHTSTVRKLHLSLMDSDSGLLGIESVTPLLEKCVDYAINHGVQALHLDALCCPPLRFPDAIFASKTLRELKLRQFDNSIYIPKGFSLPHLKTLYLENFDFMNDDGHEFCSSFSKEPFSGFPELEKLTLHRCRISGLVILGPKLRNLEMIDNEFYWSDSEAMEAISAPELTSFRCQGHFPLECSKLNFPLLEEACLNLSIRYHIIKDKGITLKCIRFLQQLGNAKNVTLSLDTIKALEADLRVIEQSSSPFPNMKYLKLRRGEGRREFPTVLQRVMNYLTEGSSCGDSLMVEFPEGVSVVESDLEDLSDEDSDELHAQLEHLFE